MEGKPLISAIISTYNSEKFIEGRIIDLLEQTISTKLEIIIVNSSSAEDEDSIIKKYQSQNSNIYYIKNEKRESIYRAWNRAIMESRGEFITNANTDGRLRKDALEILSNNLQEHHDSGLSVDSLQGRIEDSQSKLIITMDGSYNNGKVVELKRTVDEALKRCPSVENVVVVKRIGHDVPLELSRDHWYHDMLALPIANGKCATEVMDSEDPLYILYTSGSTGKPKAILHTHGGYMVYTYTTLKYVFDIKDEDRWWCAADPGWVTGHSYIVYAPLLTGATLFMYEGAPNHPYPNRWYRRFD